MTANNRRAYVKAVQTRLDGGRHHDDGVGSAEAKLLHGLALWAIRLGRQDEWIDGTLSDESLARAWRDRTGAGTRVPDPVTLVLNDRGEFLDAFVSEDLALRSLDPVVRDGELLRASDGTRYRLVTIYPKESI